MNAKWGLTGVIHLFAAIIQLVLTNAFAFKIAERDTRSTRKRTLVKILTNARLELTIVSQDSDAGIFKG